MSGAALALAAEALVGARYRLHGRDPETGLDCIGVLAAALAATGRPVALPTGYALRTRALPGLSALAEGCGFVSADHRCLPGDVVLVRPAACQLHLGIIGSRARLIHAHAGLRRVVSAPLPHSWPLLHHWRLR